MFLKKCLASWVVAAAFSGFAWSAQTYRIESGWSHIEFSVKNFGVHTVEGRFTSFAGTIAYDDADVARSSATVAVQTSSVDTGNRKRDEHLRTADFFDSVRFPEVTFHSERVVKEGEGQVMRGLLTIKGHSIPVGLPFTYKLETSAEGKKVLHGQATGLIDRHQFGLDYGNNFSVGKDVRLQIHIQAVPE